MVLEVEVHVVICRFINKHQTQMLKGNMCSNFLDHLCSNNQVKSKLMEDLSEQLMSTIKSTSMMNEILIRAPIFLRIMARHNLKSAMTLHWLCVPHPIRTRCKAKNVRSMPTYFTGIGLWREIKILLLDVVGKFVIGWAFILALRLV